VPHSRLASATGIFFYGKPKANGSPYKLCVVLTGRSFAWLSVKNITNIANENGIYISNINIIKD
jgi:hypothetical protein